MDSYLLLVIPWCLLMLSMTVNSYEGDSDATTPTTDDFSTTTNTYPTQCDQFADHRQQSCEMVQEWVKDRNAIIAAGLVNTAVPSASPTTASDQPLSDLKNMYDCMSIECFCQTLGGIIGYDANHNTRCTVKRNGKPVTFGKVKRQEIRMLSPEQRANVFRAFHAIKWGAEQNTYNSFVYQHEAPQAPCAHGGPMFPIWHREFTKRFEFALRQIDPTVGLPFWASTLDEELDDSRDSCIWSSELMGETVDGQIISGTFSNWTSIEGNYVVRDFATPKGLTTNAVALNIADYDILSIMAFTNPDETCTSDEAQNPQYDPLEYIHGDVHNFVGGDMGNTWSAPNDPIFFFHHCFIDLLYENWRDAQRYLGNNPEELYPEEYIFNYHCMSKNNSRYAKMLPFTKILNEAGMSDNYTKYLYEYDPIPICDKYNGCKSDFLFCSFQNHPHCVSKIRIGGNCQKFSSAPTSDQSALSSEETNPCYKGQCVNGKCQESSSLSLPELMLADVDLHEKRKLNDQPKVQRKKIPAKISPFRHCYDSHECCPQWASDGYCNEAAKAMNVWCPGSCQSDGCTLKAKERTSDCLDLHPSCDRWKKQKATECGKNPFWMSANCAKTCGMCSLRASIEDNCSGGPAAKHLFVDPAQLRTNYTL